MRPSQKSPYHTTHAKFIAVLVSITTHLLETIDPPKKTRTFHYTWLFNMDPCTGLRNNPQILFFNPYMIKQTYTLNGACILYIPYIPIYI